MKVIGFGDSNMNGHALLEEETWRYHVGKHFNICIQNKGINGEDSTEALKRLPSILQMDPDMVFLNHASNDVFKEMDKTGELCLDTLQANMKKIIQALKEKKTTVIYISPFVHLCGDPIHKTYFYARHNPAQYKKCSPNQCLKKTHKMLEELCTQEGVYYINLFDDFRLQEPELFVRTIENSGDDDGSHFSQEGAKRVAKVIIEQMEEQGVMTKKASQI